MVALSSDHWGLPHNLVHHQAMRLNVIRRPKYSDGSGSTAFKNISKTLETMQVYYASTGVMVGYNLILEPI